MTIDEIKARCESLSTEELHFIVNNKIQYTEVIVRVAQQELKKRNPTKEELARFKKEQAQRNKIIDGDIHEDLMLWEKIVFFFIFIPGLHALVMRDYRKRRYILKVRQARYYMTLGAISCLVLILANVENFLSLKIAAILWAAAYLATHVYNYYYFKARTIRNLAERMDDSQ
jgi:hypothetical protein